MDATEPAITPEILMQHGAFVRRLARGLLGDEHLAEDIAQETWMRWVERPPRITASARSWLRRVAQNLALNATRSRNKRAAREAVAARPEACPSPAEEVGHASTLKAVADAVAALAEPYRSTVLMRFFHGWDARRIAAHEGVPLATVRSRLQRALQSLRQQLDREHGGDRRAWCAPLAWLTAAETAHGAPIAMLAVSAKAKIAATAVALVALAATWSWLASSQPNPDANPGVVALDSADAANRAEEQLRAESSATRTAVAPQHGTLRVAGTVTNLAFAELDLTEGPAAGLALELWFEDGYDDRVQVETDAAGAFTFEIDDPGVRPLVVHVHARSDEHYRRVRHELTIADGAITPIDVRLTRAAHGIFYGLFEDDQGSPLGGITLALRDIEAKRDYEVTSDAQGSFRIEEIRIPGELRPLTKGYTLLLWEQVPWRDEGGYKRPTRVVLSRSATLEVSVQDSSGAGMAGMFVAVDLDECEQAELGSEIDGRSANTSANGRAAFANLWTGRKLRVRIRHDNLVEEEARRVRGRSLILDDAEGGRPLVLYAGETRSLRCRLGFDLSVEGTVRRADGTAIQGATILVLDAGAGLAGQQRYLVVTKTNEAGHYLARVPTRHGGRLRVVAKEPASRQALSWTVFHGGAAPTDGGAVAVTVRPSDAEQGVIHQDLIVQPTLTITGSLLAADGEPVMSDSFHRLWAAPAGARDHAAEGPLGRAGLRLHGDGRFTIWGLAAGSYDLYVSEETGSFYSWSGFLHRFPGIAAGAQGVELRVPERSEVRIVLRTHGGDPDSLSVLHGKLFPHDPGTASRNPAPREQLVTNLTGWPVGASLGFAGGGGSSDATGRRADGHYDTKEVREHALAPMEPGWYVIGVRARTGRQPYFPIATELLYFESGDYTIDFKLTPTTTVTGRVHADAASSSWAVSLVDDRGIALPLRTMKGYGRPTRALETSATGRFVLRDVPVGAFRLRVGKPDELERGGFDVELPVEYVEGENRPLEIRF